MKRQFACKINKNNLTAALFYEKVLLLSAKLLMKIQI